MRVLFVLTSWGRLGEKGLNTGFACETFTTPYYVTKDRGIEVVLASPAGGAAPVDPKSEVASALAPSVRRYRADPLARADVADTLRLEQVCPEDFDAAFYPGGHGVLWDLANCPDSASLLLAMLGAGKPVALVSHAPIALRGVVDGAGRPIISGRRVTAFSNAEESATGLAGVLPLSVENELRRLGALYDFDPTFGPHVVRDGALITGQNPASAGALVEVLLTAIGG